jgi:membrane-bound ClpP family serine protease
MNKPLNLVTMVMMMNLITLITGTALMMIGMMTPQIMAVLGMILMMIGVAMMIGGMTMTIGIVMTVRQVVVKENQLYLIWRMMALKSPS